MNNAVENYLIAKQANHKGEFIDDTPFKKSLQTLKHGLSEYESVNRILKQIDETAKQGKFEMGTGTSLTVGEIKELVRYGYDVAGSRNNHVVAWTEGTAKITQGNIEKGLHLVQNEKY